MKRSPKEHPKQQTAQRPLRFQLLLTSRRIWANPFITPPKLLEDKTKHVQLKPPHTVGGNLCTQTPPNPNPPKDLPTRSGQSARPSAPKSPDAPWPPQAAKPKSWRREKVQNPGNNKRCPSNPGSQRPMAFCGLQGLLGFFRGLKYLKPTKPNTTSLKPLERFFGQSLQTANERPDPEVGDAL